MIKVDQCCFFSIKVEPLMAPTKSWGARKDRKPPVALIKVISKLKKHIHL